MPNKTHFFVVFLSLSILTLSLCGQESDTRDFYAEFLRKGIVVVESNSGQQFALSIETPIVSLFHTPSFKHVGFEVQPAQETEILKSRKRAATEAAKILNSVSPRVAQDRIGEVAVQYENEIKETLLAEQWESLEKFPKFIAISELGIVKLLLGDALDVSKLSNEEKKRLQDKAKELKERVVREVQELEREVIRELVADLSKADGEKVTEYYFLFKRTTPSTQSILKQLGFSNADCVGCDASTRELNANSEGTTMQSIPSLKSVLDNSSPDK